MKAKGERMLGDTGIDKQTAESDKLTQMVEKRLQEAQKTKKFKDVGRKAGTRKEMNAYKIIGAQHLEDIEEDPKLAEKLVTKKRVWPAYDIEEDRARGVTAGAAYYKHHLQRSLAAKPMNNTHARRTYVKGVEMLVELLKEAKTLEEVIAVTETIFRNRKIEGIAPDLENIERSSIQAKRTGRYYWADLYKLRIEGIFGKKFAALVFQKSDSKLYKDKMENARLYQGYTEEQEQEAREKIVKAAEADIKRLQTIMDALNSDKSDDEVAKIIREFGYGVRERERGKYIFGLRLEYAKKRAANPELKEWQKARPNDWSWTKEKTNTSTKSKSKNPRINSYEFLSHLERKGGLVVEKKDNKHIKEKYALHAIQYGNALNDDESAKLTYLLNGAFSDLQEILSIDLKPIHKKSGLGIDFATRGTAGSAATYWANFRVINLNKKNGDGSLAHEWAHHLDNMLSDSSIDPAKYTKINGQAGGFASRHGTDSKFGMPVVNRVKEIMNFIRNGRGDETTEVEVIPSDKVKFRGVSPKGNFQETVEYYDKVYRVSKKHHTSWYAYLAHVCGHTEPVTYTKKIKSSYQYFESNKMGSDYWVDSAELFARAFEGYVMHRMEKMGMVSDFLQCDRDFYKAMGVYPYPDKTDMESIEPLFDGLFAHLRQHFDASYTPPPAAKRVNEIVENDTLPEDERKKNKSPLEQQEKAEEQAERSGEIVPDDDGTGVKVEKPSNTAPDKAEDQFEPPLRIDLDWIAEPRRGGYYSKKQFEEIKSELFKIGRWPDERNPSTTWQQVAEDAKAALRLALDNSPKPDGPLVTKAVEFAPHHYIWSHHGLLYRYLYRSTEYKFDFKDYDFDFSLDSAQKNWTKENFITWYLDAAKKALKQAYKIINTCAYELHKFNSAAEMIPKVQDWPAPYSYPEFLSAYVRWRWPQELEGVSTVYLERVKDELKKHTGQSRYGREDFWRYMYGNKIDWKTGIELAKKAEKMAIDARNARYKGKTVPNYTELFKTLGKKFYVDGWKVTLGNASRVLREWSHHTISSIDSEGNRYRTEPKWKSGEMRLPFGDGVDFSTYMDGLAGFLKGLPAEPTVDDMHKRGKSTDAKTYFFEKWPDLKPKPKSKAPGPKTSGTESVSVTPDLFEIVEGVHTKYGYDIWTVTLTQRVSREQFKNLLETAKSMGGYYSSYSKGDAVAGFIFKDKEQAELFGLADAKKRQQEEQPDENEELELAQAVMAAQEMLFQFGNE